MNEIITQHSGAVTEFTGERISVNDAIRLWLAKYRSLNTRNAYATEIELFARFLRAPAADAMQRFLALDDHQAHTLVDAYKASMINREKPLSPATINRSMAALNSFVKSARRHGLTALRLEAEPVHALKYRDTKGPGTPTVQRMIRAASGQFNRWKAARDEAIMRVLFSLGLRRAELVGIDLEHLDLEAGSVMIQGKGHAERHRMTVPPATLASIKAWLAYRGDKPGALFLSVDTKERLSGSGVYEIVSKLGKQVGARARPHGIRHSAITAVLDASNGDVRKARAFGRHVSATTTMAYDDNREDLGGSAARILDALIE